MKDSNKNTQHFFLYGAIGTIIEWYDFALYGYFSTIFSKLFFFSKNPSTALIEVFAIFAIGYLIRPIGGILYGHIGDKYGRKKSLLTSIVLMTMSATLIGCLPTYRHIGEWAPVLLLLLRLLQGLSAGGETTGAFTYVLEQCPENKRGFYGGSIYSIIVLGILLASLVATIIQFFLPMSQLLTWGWRIGFLLTALLGLAIFVIRLRMPESNVFVALSEKGRLVKLPIQEILKNYKTILLILIMVIAVPAASFYYVFVFLPTAAIISTSFSRGDIFLINTIAMSSMVIAMPFFGLLSDKIGYLKLMTIAAIILLIAIYPLILFIETFNLISLAIGQLILGVLIAQYEAPLPALLVNATSTKIRYSAIALSYNISFSIFGGFAPLAASFLLQRFHQSSISSLYLIICAIVSLCAIIMLYPIQSKNKPIPI